MFREIWAIDFEFRAPPGHIPEVVCCAARELLSGRRVSLWGKELALCPFQTDAETLFVAYYASSEATCFMQLGWPLPCRWIDLYAEFRTITNGRHPAAGNGLLGAMAYYNLSAIAPVEKKRLRDRIVEGPPFTAGERQEIIEYCESDVDALAALLPVMEPEIAASAVRFNQALLRGRYACAVAAMELRGVPVDAALLDDLRALWPGIKSLLVDEVDAGFGVYDGTSFRIAKFIALAQKSGWDWPRLPSGAPSLDAKTFKKMAAVYPEVEPLKQLRATMGELRLNAIAVGPDGRNRALLSPFGTKTGRNAPSSSKFIFGPAIWARFLIRPEPGTALSYLDWSAQEICIAAALSGDERLAEAALSGDPYLSFAKAAGLAPPDATKETHGQIRDRVKAMVLGVNYGMAAKALAFRLQASESEARHLLRLHRETYPRFTQWQEEHLDRCLIGRRPSTIFGWNLDADADTRPNTFRNWPIQSAGAEILHWACCIAFELGIRLCAPVHDAVLIEAPVEEIESEVGRMKAAMKEASRVVLNGMEIGIDAKVVSYPEHYSDKRGTELYSRIMALRERQKTQEETGQKPSKRWGSFKGSGGPLKAGCPLK